MKKKYRGKDRYNLHTSPVAHQTRAYPGFSCIKRLGLFLLPPGWDGGPSQGYPPALNSPVPFVTPGWREALCLAQEHNTMSPARARTWTARSGDERTNHEATAPPTTQPSQPAIPLGNFLSVWPGAEARF